MNNTFFLVVQDKAERKVDRVDKSKRNIFSMKLLLNKSEVLAFYLIILRQTLLISFFSLPYPFSSSMYVMQIRTRGLSRHCLALKITVGLQMRPVGRLLKSSLFFSFVWKNLLK